MATLKSTRYYTKQLLQAIGNSSPEELGKLAMDMLDNLSSTYREIRAEEGDGDDFEYSWEMNSGSSDRERQLADQYKRLHDEYARRFAGIPENNNNTNDEIENSQPPADDITIGVDPDSGRVVQEEGNGIEELVSDADIFGGDYK